MYRYMYREHHRRVRGRPVSGSTDVQVTGCSGTIKVSLHYFRGSQCASDPYARSLVPAFHSAKFVKLSGSTMAPPPVRTGSNGNVRVQLRGFERVYTAVDNSSTKVAHVTVVKGPVATLVQHLPKALMHTYNLHPTMRALQVRDAFHEAEIQPPITVDDVAVRRLLRVRATDAAEEEAGVWKQHVQEECEKFVNRYEDFASSFEVWADETNNTARLFLFSDHYMCDGSSGMTIFNDTLKHVVLSASQTDIEPKQYPVRTSPYNLWLDNYSVSTPLTKMAVKLLAPVIKSVLTSHTKPLLPARSDQADLVYPFKNNPSYALFESGSPETVKKVLARCKQEGVTYSGALTAAVILAYYHASQQHHSTALTDNFKVTLTMSTNLRTRLPIPIPEDVVGSFASLVPLDSVKSPGTVLAFAKFWDVARTCKQDIKNGLKSPAVAFTDIFMDQNFNSASVPIAFSKHVVKNSCTGDVNISNIGRYPYPMTHSLGDAGEISVEALFLYESVPFFSMGTLMYVSMVKSFNYAMLHKYEDGDANRLFKAYVTFAEHIGEVDANATMGDVLAQATPFLK
ncbi:unnamed protein product [Phytophthora fragariaefolia]|uniref:Unnamed protein product n=1 Tax=Phytophthora fragariaefolia TaxID=1490495 RepID=A0A9W6U664_9STRA|nr:unnamed protein product [Phytophthora fragariaefolia]